MKRFKCFLLAVFAPVIWGLNNTLIPTPMSTLQPANSNPQSVCLFTHSDIERFFHQAPVLSRSWKGELSWAVLLGKAGEKGEYPVTLQAAAPLFTSKSLSDHSVFIGMQHASSRLRIILVEGDGALFFPVNQSRYPKNMMRNIAREGCAASGMSSWHLMIDSDFEVFPAAGGKFQDPTMYLGSDGARIGVLPAFSVDLDFMEAWNKQNQNRPNEVAPWATKVGLAELVRLGKAEQFKKKSYNRGHGPTNVTKWLQEDQGSYEVQWAIGYEPYVLTRANESVLFDPAFAGYGQVAFIEELHIAGRQFIVSSDVYMVHTAKHDIFDARWEHFYLRKDVIDGVPCTTKGKPFHRTSLGSSCLPNFHARMVRTYSGFKAPVYELWGEKFINDGLACFEGCLTEVFPALKTLPPALIVCPSPVAAIQLPNNKTTPPNVIVTPVLKKRHRRWRRRKNSTSVQMSISKTTTAGEAAKRKPQDWRRTTMPKYIPKQDLHSSSLPILSISHNAGPNSTEKNTVVFFSMTGPVTIVKRALLERICHTSPFPVVIGYDAEQNESSVGDVLRTRISSTCPREQVPMVYSNLKRRFEPLAVANFAGRNKLSPAKLAPLVWMAESAHSFAWYFEDDVWVSNVSSFAEQYAADPADIVAKLGSELPFWYYNGWRVGSKEHGLPNYTPGVPNFINLACFRFSRALAVAVVASITRDRVASHHEVYLPYVLNVSRDPSLTWTPLLPSHETGVHFNDHSASVEHWRPLCELKADSSSIEEVYHPVKARCCVATLAHAINTALDRGQQPHHRITCGDGDEYGSSVSWAAYNLSHIHNQNARKGADWRADYVGLPPVAGTDRLSDVTQS